MKFVGKLLLAFLLFFTLAAILLYTVGQTHWAAKKLSHWISQNSQYTLSINNISYSLMSPAQITLNEVTVAPIHQSHSLTAQQILLTLSPLQFSEPYHFTHITLRDGLINLHSGHTALPPIQTDTLQLNNMAFHYAGKKWQLTAKNVYAGFSPWQSTSKRVSNQIAQFQLSAKTLTLNDLCLSQVLLQGKMEHGQLIFSNFGANLAQGSFTGAATRSRNGNWLITQLELNKIHWQTSLTLKQLKQRFAALPPLTVKQFNLIDAQLEGSDWAANDLNVSLKNAQFENGGWSSKKGSFSLNASDLIKNDFHLQQPIINAQLSPEGVNIQQLSTRWQHGLIRTTGKWLRTDHRLQLDHLTIAALEYTLPKNWLVLWQQKLPSWLAEIYVDTLSVSHNLLIDTTPSFPFQITGLDGYGNQLLLASHHQLGIWSGSLNFDGSEATFNKRDVRLPSIALKANTQKIDITDLSALLPNGVLHATASINQLPGKSFTLLLNGQSVPLDMLEAWGWQRVPLIGNGNLELQLKGQLSGNQPLTSSLVGVLHATDQNGGSVVQQRP